MSIALNETGLIRPSWLRAVADWFRHARAALSRPSQNELSQLSDDIWADVGAGPADVERAVDRDFVRLGLLNLGWQQAYRPARRR